jgi:N-acetylglucosamine-6-phosphate deacetylase
MNAANARRLSGCAVLLAAFIAVSLIRPVARGQAPPSTTPPEGLRENTPAVHALVNAKLVVAPGRTIDNGTVIVRDGVIVAVGAGTDVAAPADARVWDLNGKMIYPGLIDAYGESSDGQASRSTGGPPGASTTAASPAPELLRTPTGGATHWNSRVTPHLSVAEQYRPDADTNKRLRSQGIVARLVAPSRNIVKGTSAAVTTGDADGSQSILRPNVAMHVQLTPGGSFGTERSYPVSPMGAVALVRQTILDAQWYAKAQEAWTNDPSLPRPEKNDALAALQPVVSGAMPVMIDTGDEQYALRADRVAREFKLNALIRGSGQEYRRIDDIAATGRPVILPVNYTRAPDVASPESALNYSLEDLMDWDLQPENPARLERAGVKFAFTTHGLRDKATFLAAVRKAVARGLPRDAALRALTTTPAELLGLSRSHGSIETGKSANFVVTDGDLFETRTKILETWIDGSRHEVTPHPKDDVRGTWTIALGDPKRTIQVRLIGDAARPRGSLVTTRPATRPGATQPTTRPSTTGSSGRRGGGRGDSSNNDENLANLAFTASQLSFNFKGDAFGMKGIVQLTATVSGDAWTGLGIRPDGSTFLVSAKRTAPYDPQQNREEADKAEAADALENAIASGAPTTRPVEPIASSPERTDPPPGERERPTTQVTTPREATAAAPATQPTSPALARQAERASTQPALFDVNYPLGAFGRPTLPDQPAAVLFVNATVWTCGPRGKLEAATVLVEHGKITAVITGDDEVPNIPPDALVIDCTNRHISPGIIDCHSHVATDGGVNEGSQSVTCEVRIGDFIDPTDVNIYRQLGGGVTASNILHGSANTIGGQSQVIKLRWGAGAEDMKFAEAAPLVKFALGENVKRSSSETSTRYPRTRMGVDQIIRDAFSAARDYRRAWNEYRSTRKGIPPRVDLELEALVEILDGRRKIHCHSYRQDEILALLRTCDEFGVKVAVLQHILEGYKVADAIAKHGASASSFSDWWAYKFEVLDAIPYGGSIMRDAGVMVSFNSDDAELARRLNTEAAKAMKYGGVPEEEALKFVTLHPAKQLRVDQHVGSIEPGKHADLVLWSGPPMSTYARAEQTWIDGRRYFDRQEDHQMRQKAQQMRAALVQKILTGGSEGGNEGEEPSPRPRDLWRHDQSCPSCECGVHFTR